MEKITRENLVEKYQEAVKNLEKLEKKEYKYNTKRACQPFGEVAHMSLKDCVQGYATVHDGVRNVETAMAVLGVSNDDLQTDERKYLGYTITEWDEDFKMRVSEIKDEQMAEKYKKVIELFKKNFSDDDRFAIEMGEIANLGVEL